MNTRIINHPLFLHPRSRGILLIFLGVAGLLGAFVWWQATEILFVAGVPVGTTAYNAHPTLNFFVSSSFRIAALLTAIFLGAAFTAFRVVGPIHRVEQWLMDIHTDREVELLKVRRGDAYGRLIHLLNDLVKKEASHQKKDSPSE